MKQLEPLYGHFCSLLYDSVKMRVREDEEMRALATAIWRVASVPLYMGAAPTTLSAIRPAFTELLRDALATLLPRTEGPAEWTARREAAAIAAVLERRDGGGGLAASAHAPAPGPCLPCKRTGFSVMGAFLLIAAFLASYNPTKTDVKFYVRELGSTHKRRRRRKAGTSAADVALQELEGEKEIWVCGHERAILIAEPAAVLGAAHLHARAVPRHIPGAPEQF